MTAVLLVVFLAAPVPDWWPEKAVVADLSARLRDISEALEESPDRALVLLDELLDDPGGRQLQGRSARVRALREQAIHLRGSLRIGSGQAAAVVAEMNDLLAARQSRYLARVAALAGMLASARPLDAALSVPPGAPLNCWDWYQPLSLRSQAWAKLGDTARATADAAAAREAIRDVFQGIARPQVGPSAPVPRPWWAVWVNGLLNGAHALVTSPLFPLVIVAAMWPVFFVTGRQQRRDAGGSWARLAWVSLALAGLQAVPVLTAFLVLRAVPDGVDRPLVAVVTGSVLVVNFLWLRLYLLPLVWVSSSVAPPLLEDPVVLDRIRALAARLGIRPPVTRLVRSPSGRQMNEAMVSGLAAPTMLLYDGILYRLSDDERDAVIAHELAHLANHTFWYWLAGGCLCGIAVVVASAFLHPLVVLGFGTFLMMGTTLILSRMLELDCDRRAARAIGHRRAASALWKVHADQPFRHLPVLEFLIGAVTTHPSRDERIDAIRSDAPPEVQPEIEEGRGIGYRRLAAWLAAAVWAAALVGCAWWSLRWPRSALPALPLLTLMAAPFVLLWLGTRKAEQRNSRLQPKEKTGGGWLRWVLSAVTIAWLAADYFHLTRHVVDVLTSALIMVVLSVGTLLSLFLFRGKGREKKLILDVTIAIQATDYARALRLCEENAAVVAGSSAMRHNRALVLALLGRIDEAIQESEQLVRDDPSIKLTAIMLSSLYENQGRFADALEVAATVTRDLPDQPTGPQLEAWLLRKLGRLDEAEAKARRALALEPQGGESYLTLAGVALDRGDVAAARDHLAHAEKLVPGTVGVDLLTAELALVTVDPGAEAAVRKLQAAARNNPMAFADREAAELAARLEARRVTEAPGPDYDSKADEPGAAIQPGE